MDTNKNYQEELEINDGALAYNIISWVFGLIAFVIGVVNTFWGGDTGFGIFIILLSFVYFLPVNSILNKVMGFEIPKIRLVRVLVGMFIIWAAMGVGELFDKIEMMMIDLK